jgi:hypothetical protein
MIKKLVTITALAMLLGSPTSYAAIYSGNLLVGHCEPDDATFTDGLCYGYVYGVYDVIEGARACAPDVVTGKQLVNIVRKYLKENPENLHHNAASLVTFALAQAFPCSD